MDVAVTKIAIICFFIMGISHIVRPRVWVQFFRDMHSRGEVGSFQNGFLHFPLGVVIVTFHNIWYGLPLVLTLIGWGLVIKSFIYFVFPAQGLKMLERVSMERSWHFVVAGFIAIAISALLIYTLP